MKLNIDWNKVPERTRIEIEGYNGRMLFMEYFEGDKYRFKIYIEDYCYMRNARNIKMHKSVKIMP